MKHPANREFYSYWDEKRDGAPAPERSDLNPEQVRHLLGDIFVLSCDEAAGYPFRVAGTRMCALLGRDHRVGAGGSTKTWSDFATVWAQFIPENVKEKIQQGRIADQTAGRIIVRYSSTTEQIDGTFRVILDGVTMNVKSAGVDIDQKKAQLVFPVETDGSQL